MIAYKVLRELDGEFYSGFYGEIHSKTKDALQYKVGEITEPIVKHSRLFVFDTFANAEFWKNQRDHIGNLIIRQVKIKKRDVEPDPNVFFVQPTWTDIDYWLKKHSFVASDIDRNKLPKGSLAVKKLILL